MPIDSAGVKLIWLARDATFGGDIKEQDQRIAIAEACGFKIGKKKFRLTDGWHTGKRWERPDYPICGGGFYGWGYNDEANVSALPNYLNDLDAMHEAEKTIDPESKAWKNYPILLWSAMNGSLIEHWGTIHATAAQRAEAFLRALNLWTG